MTTTCKRCNDTGYLFRKFYTPVRQCSCSLGRQRAEYDALSIEERAARDAAAAAAMRAERTRLRHERRAARRAAEQG